MVFGSGPQNSRADLSAEARFKSDTSCMILTSYRSSLIVLHQRDIL